jgi:hypothetical protein
MRLPIRFAALVGAALTVVAALAGPTPSAALAAARKTHAVGQSSNGPQQLASKYLNLHQCV